MYDCMYLYIISRGQPLVDIAPTYSLLPLFLVLFHPLLPPLSLSPPPLSLQSPISTPTHTTASPSPSRLLSSPYPITPQSKAHYYDRFIPSRTSSSLAKKCLFGVTKVNDNKDWQERELEFCSVHVNVYILLISVLYTYTYTSTYICTCICICICTCICICICICICACTYTYYIIVFLSLCYHSCHEFSHHLFSPRHRTLQRLSELNNRIERCLCTVHVFMKLII